MPSVNNSRILSIAVSLCILVLSAALAGAQTPEFKSVEPVKYKRIFLDKPPGTVAFLARLGRPEYLDRVNEFHILPASGFYKLPPRGAYFFQINNRMAEHQVSFLVAAIYCVYPKGVSRKTAVYFNRNATAEWQGGKYEDGTLRQLTANSGVGRLTLKYDELWDKHRAGKLKEVDEIMRRNWHAWPDAQGEGSWDIREDLAQGPPAEFQHLLTACGLKQDTADIALTVELIRFETSTVENSKKPLYFWFGGDNAVAAYLHLKSPWLSDYSRDFYFSFQK